MHKKGRAESYLEVHVEARYRDREDRNYWTIALQVRGNTDGTDMHSAGSALTRSQRDLCIPTGRNRRNRVCVKAECRESRNDFL